LTRAAFSAVEASLSSVHSKTVSIKAASPGVRTVAMSAEAVIPPDPSQ
jgi:hypothetical protein